jgi:hypothetical protein
VEDLTVELPPLRALTITKGMLWTLFSTMVLVIEVCDPRFSETNTSCERIGEFDLSGILLQYEDKTNLTHR